MIVNLSRRLMLTLVLVSLLNLVAAVVADARQIVPSKNEVQFELTGPTMAVRPERIVVEQLENGNKKDVTLGATDFYLEATPLRGPQGSEITPDLLTISTKYRQEPQTLSRAVRVLTSADQDSWFEIGIAPSAAYVRPGVYQGALRSPDQSWEVNVSVIVRRFVHLAVAPKHVEFYIPRPGIYGNNPPKWVTMTVASNHQDWQVWMELKPEVGLIHTERDDWVLLAERLYFAIEEERLLSNLAWPRPVDSGELSGYTQLGRDRVLVSTGATYQGPDEKVLFLVEAQNDWHLLRAGEYTGAMVFTVVEF